MWVVYLVILIFFYHLSLGFPINKSKKLLTIRLSLFIIISIFLGYLYLAPFFLKEKYWIDSHLVFYFFPPVACAYCLLVFYIFIKKPQQDRRDMDDFRTD